MSPRYPTQRAAEADARACLRDMLHEVEWQGRSVSVLTRTGYTITYTLSDTGRILRRRVPGWPVGVSFSVMDLPAIA